MKMLYPSSRITNLFIANAENNTNIATFRDKPVYHQSEGKLRDIPVFFVEWTSRVIEEHTGIFYRRDFEGQTGIIFQGTFLVHVCNNLRNFFLKMDKGCYDS